MTAPSRPSTPPTPRPLPLPPMPLVGREAEVAAGCERLTAPEVRLLTLSGAVG